MFFLHQKFPSNMHSTVFSVILGVQIGRATTFSCNITNGGNVFKNMLVWLGDDHLICPDDLVTDE